MTGSPVSEPKRNQSNVRSMRTTHVTKKVLRCKVVMVGDAHVGKTALCQMFQTDGQNYPKNYVMTLGVELGVKTVDIPDTNTQVELYVFDTAGQSVLNQTDTTLSRICEHASVAVFVYDVDAQDSFQSVSKWLSAVRSANDGKPIPGVLIANKSDRKENGTVQVSSEEGMEFAQKNGLTFFECSAMRNFHVDAPFNFIANAFYSKYLDTINRLKQS